MPRLSIFVLCEKVIIDDGGIASLIGLFNEIKAVSPPGSSFPQNAAVPKEWAVFVTWLVDDGDEGAEFDQTVQVRLPDETVFSEINQRFVMQKDKNQQVKINFAAIPVGIAGKCSIHLSLKHSGRVISEPPPIYLKISHLPSEPKPS